MAAAAAAGAEMRSPRDPAVVLQLVPSRAAASFDHLPERARDVLRLCDGTRTLETISAISPLPRAPTERVVGRLLELGVVVAQPAPPPRRRRLTPEGVAWMRERSDGVRQGASAGFSADDEAFFASPIDHLIGDDFYD